jgi:hypothetical protein
MQPYKGCSIPFTYGTENLERPEGVEPSPYGLEDRRAAIEHYGRKMCGLGTCTPLRTPTVASCDSSTPLEAGAATNCYRTRP